MPIANLTTNQPGQIARISPTIKPDTTAYTHSRTAKFNQILQAADNNSAGLSTTAPPVPHKKLFLGVIDNNSPTVSHLLTKNPTMRKDAWNIIFSEINKNKNFEEIPKGDTVELDLQTNEITWHKARRQAPVITPDLLAKQELTADDQIIIGKIGPKSPTVSHLLRHNKIYHDEAWNIILSSVNKDKPYKLLRNGTSVAINPQTFELSFFNGSQAHDHGSTAKIPGRAQTISSAASENLSNIASDFFTANKPFANRMVDSIRSYIGKPYSQIDCYGLLVRGLKSQGIQYGGTGGLRAKLEQTARENGEPLNAYQNGEGLVATAGKTIFAKSFDHITHPENLSQNTFTDMKPDLHEGMILSFSTPSRGHTGIISKDKGEWTYINSGLMDHPLHTGKISRRVGEESLRDELTNWFKLADDRHESLKITMGMLNEAKLREMTNDISRFARNDVLIK